jgi:hypothetical protein
VTGIAIAPRIEGVGGVTIDPEGRISATGVSPGSFQRNPALLATNSLAPVLFWSAPFTVLEAGDVFINMDAISFMANADGAATIMGVIFTCDVDGNPLPDAGVQELSIAVGSVNTWTTQVVLQSVAPGLAVGPHMLNIFMFVLDANCTAQTAAGEASVRITRI